MLFQFRETLSCKLFGTCTDMFLNHPRLFLGRLGEDPLNIPNNLLPYVAQVAIGRRPHLTIFGGDYDTPDGTGVRDFIHVVDLALAHVAAIRIIMANKNLGHKIYNLGTGTGYSVLEIVEAFKEASGREIPYIIGDRRPMDVASCYSDPSLAKKELNWEAKRGLKEMCEDQWNWQSQNPHGYIQKGEDDSRTKEERVINDRHEVS